jgi:translocation and assembly module TamB
MDLEPEPETEAAAKPATRKAHWGRWLAIAAAALVALLVLALAGVRIGVRTEAGRALLTRSLDGLPLGPVGRLHIAGLAGDPLDDFSLQRLQIVDTQGVWLDGQNLSLRWSPLALLERRVHAERLAAGRLTVLRGPAIAPQPPSKGGRFELPVAIQVDQVHLGLETRPAISIRAGAWDIDGGFALERNLSAKGHLSARSRLHAGDGLNADFRLGEQGRIELRADAVEASGGGLAGLLGLAADQRLLLQARAEGTAETGALQVQAASGPRQPLTADATWAGGVSHLKAHLDMTASRWTTYLAERAGQQADLTAEARHLSADTFQLHAALVAPAANVTIDGPLDWRAISSRALNTRVAVADLSRWAPVKIGATVTQGVVAGDMGRFLYKGSIEGRRFDEWGYTLDRIAGPVEFGRQLKVWTVNADLGGAGGGGKGWLYALLGHAPHAKIDGARLADGRYMIRQLDGQGDGLKLSGQGGQGLFGDLSFKGRAQFSNLAAAYRNAKGVVTADWSASQARKDPAWRFTLDASAAKFALGMAQPDHFIGASPKLKATAAYNAGVLQIAQAQFTGAALSAGVKGRLDTKGGVGLDVTWQATGPFDTGPLEIAGAASGGGHLTGSLGAPKLDLTADVASLALGQLIVKPAHVALTLDKAASGGLGGTVALGGSSAYGPASVKAAFELADGGLAVHGLDADAGGVKAAGSLALRDGAPSTADLTLQAKAGAFLSRGQLSGAIKLTQAAGGLTAHIALDGQNLAAPGMAGVLHTASLHADGPWSRLPFHLSADSVDPVAWRFAGDGVLDQTAPVRVLTLNGGGRARKVDFKTLQPAVLRFGDHGRDLALHLSVSGGKADVTAHQDDTSLNAVAKLAGVSLAAVNPDLAGAVDADLTLNGHGANLTGALDANLSGARTRDAPKNLALAGQFHAQLGGSRLKISTTATNAQGLKSSLQVDLPAEASAAPFRIAIDRTKPLSGSFSADGELRPLWDLLVGGEQNLSGHVVTAGTLSGSLNGLHAAGHATLADGRYQNGATGLNLQDFALAADFDQNHVEIGQATGADGHGGKITGSGNINLTKGGSSSFKLTLNHFRLIDNETVRASTSGDVTVIRDNSGAAKVSGALKIDRADIVPNTPTPSGVVDLDVREINLPYNPDEPVAPPKASAVQPPVTMDVSIRASRGVFVRGKGLNAELSLEAHVGGSVTAPELTGRANVVLGSYDFAGKRFDFDQRSYITLDTRPDRIRLDLSATLSTPTLTAVIDVRGTAARPEITLSSTPQLPQDEVLSQVLFGSSASQLSGGQAAELASAVASLAGGGGFDFLGRLRQFAGLDRLSVGQTAPTLVNGKLPANSNTNGTSVSGGKYVTDNVYVELTGGGREGPSAAVEWRVLKNFSIISQVGTQGDAQLSIQWRKNFK